MSTPGPSTPAPAVRRSLSLSVVDGVMHAIMLGASESWLGALAVELGHRDTALAMLATLPLLVGAVAQLAAGPLTAWVGSRKRFVVGGAAVQAASVAALVAIALMEEGRLWPFLSIKCVFWASGNVIAPAWGAWMARLTRDVDKTRYFARRGGAIQVALLASFVGSGAALAGIGSSAFGWMFVAGMLARVASVVALALKVEPPENVRRFELRERLRDAWREGGWRIPAYMAALMLGAHVAVPFFTPYMLRDLGLDWAVFTGLTAVSILGKALAFAAAHRLASRLGMRAVLLGGGIGVAAVPLAWIGNESLVGLAAVQLVGGTVWALYEYASFQLLFEGSPVRCRVEYLALAGTLIGIGQLVGALLGSYLREAWDASYPGVFLVSGCLRTLALLVLIVATWRIILAPVHMFTRLLSVRPVAGALRRPFLTDEGD
jgi:MFS family permease